MREKQELLSSLREKEIKRLVKSLPKKRSELRLRHRAMLLLCFSARIGLTELLSRRRDQFREGALSHRGKKIQLSSEACAALVLYLKQVALKEIREEDPFLFVGTNGKQLKPKLIRNGFRKLCALAIGKDIRPEWNPAPPFSPGRTFPLAGVREEYRTYHPRETRSNQPKDPSWSLREGPDGPRP